METAPTKKYLFDDSQHLHSLDGKPLMGTSTIVNEVIAKPLTWWAAGKALESLGWTNPKLVKKEEGIKLAGKARKNFFISNAEYYDWLQECYRAHSVFKDKKAVEGTDMHAELEHFVKAKMGKVPMRADYAEKIKPFIEWAEKNVKTFIASEAHCYSEKLWCGGITDAIAELNDGKLAVIDFKSSKDAYTSQFIQVAGYSIQVEENGLWDATGTHNKKLEKEFNAFIVVPFGAEKVEPVIRYDVSALKEGFASAVSLYKILKQ